MLNWIVDFILSEETEEPSVLVGAILHYEKCDWMTGKSARVQRL